MITMDGYSVGVRVKRRRQRRSFHALCHLPWAHTQLKSSTITLAFHRRSVVVRSRTCRPLLTGRFRITVCVSTHAAS
jgi:hypothetical protein